MSVNTKVEKLNWFLWGPQKETFVPFTEEKFSFWRTEFAYFAVTVLNCLFCAQIVEIAYFAIK